MTSAALHTEILTTEAREQLPIVQALYEEFYLAGGTALALQICHRVSVDFDFFSDAPIKKTLLARMEALFPIAHTVVLLNNARELTLQVNGVKYTFLHYPFPLVYPLVEERYLRLLCTKELLVTKAYSIGRRGSFKDYYDLYTGLNEKHITLQELLDSARRKYGDAFQDRLFLEQLLFMDDVEEMAIVPIDRPIVRQEEMVKSFAACISEWKTTNQ
jgi:predicted nucleotidyltransferase component of viral defense system